MPCLKRLCLTLAVACTVLAMQHLYAQDSSEFDGPRAVLFTGLINADCIPDTVLGVLAADNSWDPKHIRWGQPPDDSTSPCAEAATSVAQRAKKRKQTVITYPAWETVNVAFSTSRYNTNDTLDDLTFWMWGTARDENDSLVEVSRALVVFGQRNIDTLQKIVLGGTEKFRSDPYIGMELEVGTELVNPTIRKDEKGRGRNFELVRVEVDMSTEEEDSAGIAMPGMAAPAARSSVGRVWPNPATISTSVEVESLVGGRYTVELAGVDGGIISTSDVTIADGEDLLRTIDLTHLATGWYVLRVRGEGGFSAVYPLVIVK